MTGFYINSLNQSVKEISVTDLNNTIQDLYGQHFVIIKKFDHLFIVSKSRKHTAGFGFEDIKQHLFFGNVLIVKVDNTANVIPSPWNPALLQSKCFFFNDASIVEKENNRFHSLTTYKLEPKETAGKITLPFYAYKHVTKNT